MKNISVTEARKELGDIFGVVSYYKERIILTNHKKKVAIVPIEDLEMLEAMEKEQLNKRLKKSIQQSKEGKVKSRGSFAKYVEDGI
jgi:prevent-host-death family protein